MLQYKKAHLEGKSSHPICPYKNKVERERRLERNGFNMWNCVGVKREKNETSKEKEWH